MNVGLDETGDQREPGAVELACSARSSPLPLRRRAPADLTDTAGGHHDIRIEHATPRVHGNHTGTGQDERAGGRRGGHGRFNIPLREPIASVEPVLQLFSGVLLLRPIPCVETPARPGLRL